MQKEETKYNLEEIYSHLNQSLDDIKQGKIHDAEKVFNELLLELESYNFSTKCTNPIEKRNVEALLKDLKNAEERPSKKGGSMLQIQKKNSMFSTKINL